MLLSLASSATKDSEINPKCHCKKIYIEQYYRDMKHEMNLDLNIVSRSQIVNSKGYFFTMKTLTMLTMAALLQSSNESLKYL